MAWRGTREREGRADAGGRRPGPAVAPLALLALLGAWPATCPAASDPAAAPCARAAAAEQEAAELERNAERRARFLAGTGAGAGTGGGASGAAASGADPALRAAVGEARALLPKLGEAAAAARHDRGAVPGLGDWFDRVAQELTRAVQGAEACASAPARCAPPVLGCPAPPPLPPASRGASGDFVRQVQQAYARNAAMVRQACQSLGASLRQAADRAGRGGGAASPAGPVSGTELYWVRIRALRAEAARSRQEADRLAGVAGACRLAGRGPDRPAAAATPPRVADLKAAWAQPWSTGSSLAAPAAPLPRLGAGTGPALAGQAPPPGATAPAPSWWRSLAAAGAAGREAARERAREFWRGELAAWEEANQQVELAEFVKSRPKALVEDVASSLLEGVPGGRAVTAGYKILSAVKETTGEVMQIVTEAPQVIVHGDEAATAELAGRADRVPLHFMLNLFDDQAGKVPRPKWRAREASGD